MIWLVARAMCLLMIAVACSAPAAQSSPTPTPIDTRTPASSATPTPTQTGSATDAHAGGPVAGVVTPASITLPTSVRISTPSAEVTWAAVGGVALFRSTDRGDTWRQHGLPPSALDLEGVAFVSDREGWLSYLGAVVGAQCELQPAQLWHTADAGTTYATVPASGLPDEGCKGPLAFIDAKRGFVGTWRGTSAALQRTNDGGTTWTGSALRPPPGAAGATLEIGAVRAFGSILLVDVAVTGVGQPGHVVYRSTDGGASWALTGPGSFPGAVAFVTATRWLQLLGPDGALETTDAGATWRGFATDYQQAAPVAPLILFADASVGYATVRGAIQRTSDGGAHWSPIRTPGT